MKRNRILIAALLLSGTFTFAACEGGDTDVTEEEVLMEDEMHGEAMDNMDDAMEMEGTEANTDIPDVPEFSDVEVAVLDQLDAVVVPYLQMKEAMVAADLQRAQELAKQLLENAGEVNVSMLQEEPAEFAREHLAALTEAAQAVLDAGDIETAREAFYPLSQQVFMLANAFDITENPLYYQHCPMAFDNEGAYWVSETKEVRNPYFGDKMLHCGSTVTEF